MKGTYKSEKGKSLNRFDSFVCTVNDIEDKKGGTRHCPSRCWCKMHFHGFAEAIFNLPHINEYYRKKGFSRQRRSQACVIVAIMI